MSVPESHWKIVVPRLLAGKVVLFLGAGVNLSVRKDKEPWAPFETLPSGAELAQYLADSCGYEERDRDDLLRVSQYMTLVEGSAPLYESLHKLMDVDYAPTPLHEFVARLPNLMKESPDNGGRRKPLIITTNYDDVLERALRAAGEEFDTVYYAADGAQRGKFWHLRPGTREPELIETPNEYQDVSTEKRTVLLKIHGNVDRGDATRDSYVVTEDHYIDYLTRTDLSSLVPAMLAKVMRTSHFLFMGYGLRDWNLRVILHRLWGKQSLTYQSWAIQKEPKDLDKKFWAARAVEVIDEGLAGYVEALVERCGPKK